MQENGSRRMIGWPRVHFIDQRNKAVGPIVVTRLIIEGIFYILDPIYMKWFRRVKIV